MNQSASADTQKTSTKKGVVYVGLTAAAAALLGDFAENFFLALDQATQVAQAFLDGAELFLIEFARRFLAVAGDKRNSIVFVEQADGRLGLFRFDMELRSDGGSNIFS